jgi:UDP-N-acetylmuramoyl-tripeptide--D-alanyl-D-alanine ligase
MDRRLKVHHLPNEVSLIDDTYSANPQASMAAIDVLQNIGGQKKVVVLGSMLELGSYSVEGHREVGKYIAKNNVDLLFTFGTEAKEIVNGAIESGFPADSARHFSTEKKLHSELKKAISKNTTILVKGSNKVKLNKTVLFLMKYFKYRKVKKRKRILRKK